MVKFTDASGRLRRCELADLLIVVDVITAGQLVRRATLIQAKMARAAGRVMLSGKSSYIQLDLYQNWYLFDFEDPAYRLSRLDFNVGGAAKNSGTFGVIDRHLKDPVSDPPVWTQHAATPTPALISNQPRLGEFIAEMMDGARTGFGRPSTPSLQTDWSKAVERLLAVTYARAFQHKPTLGPVRATRGVRAVACMSFQTMPNLMIELWGRSRGRPPEGVEIHEDDGQPTGISLVHLAVTAS